MPTGYDAQSTSASQQARQRDKPLRRTGSFVPSLLKSGGVQPVSAPNVGEGHLNALTFHNMTRSYPVLTLVSHTRLCFADRLQ